MGMGISAILALLSIGLSLLGQSPKFLRRTGLSGARLDLRVRTFTALGFALLLLVFGFFIAGVPIGGEVSATAAISDSDTPLPILFDGSATVSPTSGNTSIETLATSMIPATPQTGAFGGPPQSTQETVQPAIQGTDEVAEPVGEETGVRNEVTSTPTPSPSPSQTSSPSSPITPTLTPTNTPTPSLTPTPIQGETQQISTQGSTLWLKRSPGGQNIALLQDGDIVLVLSGHANQGGIVWREVRTLEGIGGWLPEEYLLPLEE